MTERFQGYLEEIDEERRETLKKLVKAAAFAVPMMASFSIDGALSTAAAVSNMTVS